MRLEREFQRRLGFCRSLEQTNPGLVVQIARRQLVAFGISQQRIMGALAKNAIAEAGKIIGPDQRVLDGEALGLRQGIIGFLGGFEGRILGNCRRRWCLGLSKGGKICQPQ